jgi:hypothetical protein
VISGEPAQDIDKFGHQGAVERVETPGIVDGQPRDNPVRPFFHAHVDVRPFGVWQTCFLPFGLGFVAVDLFGKRTRAFLIKL